MNEMRLQGVWLPPLHQTYQTENKPLGLFLRVSRDLLGATLIANGTNYTTSSLVHTAQLCNLQSGAEFYVIRHDTSA